MKVIHFQKRMLTRTIYQAIWYVAKQLNLFTEFFAFFIILNILNTKCNHNKEQDIVDKRNTATRLIQLNPCNTIVSTTHKSYHYLEPETVPSWCSNKISTIEIGNIILYKIWKSLPSYSSCVFTYFLLFRNLLMEILQRIS